MLARFQLENEGAEDAEGGDFCGFYHFSVPFFSRTQHLSGIDLSKSFRYLFGFRPSDFFRSSAFGFRILDGVKNSTHIAKRFKNAGHWIVFFFLVLEADVERVPQFHQSLQDSNNIDDPEAYLDRLAVGCSFGDVLHMEIIKAVNALMDHVDRVQSQAHCMPDVDADTHTFVSVLDQAQHVQW